ncbi:MAG: DUF456 family protein [Verrucomicrobiales bacterium]|nr:DUF456 family protein [Verrucomicrobiales bacterium]MCP5527385.1 DUF456 family protein [Verrucomicrobiales bacterium]
MTWGELFGYFVTLLLMLVGVAGSFIPGIPGPPLVLAAAVAHKLVFGADGASVTVLVVMTLLTLLSLALDFVASLVGAKKLGATWLGMTGAVVGGVAGLFMGLVAVIVGPFVGAVVFELLGGRKLEEAGRAGVGAMVGLLAGTLGKLACAIAMTGLFAVSVLLNQGP